HGRGPDRLDDLRHPGHVHRRRVGGLALVGHVYPGHDRLATTARGGELMPGLVLQPINQVAKAALAQQLACWAKAANGVTDRAVQYGTCCVSPTGETLGRWTIPPEMCDTYGELPFTSQGEPIVCDAGQTQFVPYYIYPED